LKTDICGPSGQTATGEVITHDAAPTYDVWLRSVGGSGASVCHLLVMPQMMSDICLNNMPQDALEAHEKDILSLGSGIGARWQARRIAAESSRGHGRG
jgi:hypothetical protein